jgi:hypothetical protein
MIKFQEKFDIICKHNAGFFSCCSVKLNNIVDYINSKHLLPTLDCSTQFSMYKHKYRDITYDYFKHYDNDCYVDLKTRINYHENYQFSNYSRLDYHTIVPIVKKYFSPSDKILRIVEELKYKYKLYDEYIGVYYRGTDKISETKLADFQDFYNKIIELKTQTGLKIILQTDSTHFLKYITSKIDVIVIEENDTSSSNGIHFINNSYKNYNDMFYLFATFLILSKCKYLIIGSSNGSIWITFYRGNSINVYQYLNGEWFNSIQIIE